MGRLSKEQLDEYLGEEKAKKYYKDLEKHNNGKIIWSINWRGILCTPMFAMKYGVVLPIYTHSYLFILLSMMIYALLVYTGGAIEGSVLLGALIFITLLITGSKHVFFQSIEKLIYKYGHRTAETVTPKQLWFWSLFFYFPFIILAIIKSDISFDFSYRPFDQASHDRFEKALKELKRPNPLQVLATGYEKVPPQKVERVNTLDPFWNLFSEDIENLPYDYVQKKGLAHPLVRNDKEQIVIDKTLGLMWQDDQSVEKPIAYLKDANKSCEELVLGGYEDWHLPTAYELLSISDPRRYDRFDREIEMEKYPFKYERDYEMWSNTFLKNDKNQSIVVSRFNSIKISSGFYDYYSNLDDTLYMYGRRCVRREHPLEEIRRFEYVEDVNREVILDKGTSLMWQNNSYEKALDLYLVNYYNKTRRETRQLLAPIHAFKYCQELELGGYDDWYLPNKNQLFQIQKYMDYVYDEKSDPFVIRVDGYEDENPKNWNSSTFNPNRLKIKNRTRLEKYEDEAPHFTRCVRDAKVWKWND